MKNEKLVAARKRSGKNQVQVAKEVGIATIAYQSYELRKRTPIVTTAIRIAKTLGTTVEELWDTKERRS